VRSLGLEYAPDCTRANASAWEDNVGGIAVHIGARIAARRARRGAGIEHRQDLVVGSGLNFQDRGNHALKGVEGEWRLFAAA
jgi:hypothetical protein